MSRLRLTAAGVVLVSVGVFAQRGAPPPAGPPPTPRAAAPIDLTGYWVSVVTEDWRYRMVTPTRGDYQGVPMTQEAFKVADAWNPDADTAAGNACKSYGTPAIMRVPGRLHVAWDDDSTLHVDTDAGSQTRLFRFSTPGAAPRPKGEPSWQGESAATWELQGRGRGRGTQPPPAFAPGGSAPGASVGGPVPAPGGSAPGASVGGPVPAPGGSAPGASAGAAAGRGVAPPRPQFGSLKVVTTNLRAGYLRKNGVPYSENTTVTEYFDLVRLRAGDELIVVTTIVEDSRFLTQPFITSTQFSKQRDAAGWEPTPCSATW